MRKLLLVTLAASLGACANLPDNDAAPQGAGLLQTDHPVTVVGDSSFPAKLQLIGARDALDARQPIPAPEPGDVWNRIRAGFVFDSTDHRRIEQELNWHRRNPEYMQRVVERARPYLHHIVETIEQYHLPSELALLPIVESAFQPFAYSHGRAAGIWQFIPSTGRHFGLEQNWWYDGRRDIHASTLAAVTYLEHLNNTFDGDWMLALAAYNAGTGTVRRAIRRNQQAGLPTDYFSLQLPRETMAYVPKLLALKKIILDPASFGIELDTIEDHPYFTKISLDGQIDLAKAAELAGIELDELYQLNPGFNRWATAPDGPHHLLIPITQASVFRQQLASLPAEQRITWIRHPIRSGDTLIGLASRYNTSIDVIRRVNGLTGNQVRVGQSLTIPVASQNATAYRLSESQRTRALQDRDREGERVTHIVQRGDTFWDLAQRHNVSVRALAQWNGMAPRDPLIPGQTLVIWSRNPEQATADPLSELDIPQQRRITQRIGYRVRQGDSLARISQRFGVSIRQLREWNNLHDDRYLQPGQRLTLYVDVTQTSG